MEIKSLGNSGWDMLPSSSYHGTHFTTTFEKLNNLLGNDLGASGDDKVKHEFLVEVTTNNDNVGK